MLIPSIDLQGGRVVQLVQGRDLAHAWDDVFAWVERFAEFPVLQLIDLDAAMGRPANADLVQRICEARPCRVGGGVRSVDRARELLDAGAEQVIVGSRLFRDGTVDLAFAGSLATGVGATRVLAAIDSKGGEVVVDGWRASAGITAVEAASALAPFCGGFLYTHVDTEGLMAGIDLAAVERVRQATSLPLTAAGGISTWAEIDALERMGVDAVVGMALYTGRLGPRPDRSSLEGPA